MYNIIEIYLDADRKNMEEVGKLKNRSKNHMIFDIERQKKKDGEESLYEINSK